MKRIFGLLVALVMLFGFLVQAHATLITIGQAQYGGQNYNLIWDNDSPFGSIVWLDYTTNENTWQTQVNWAAGLNSGGVLTYNIDPLYIVTWSGNWRLPETVDGPLDDPSDWGYDGTTTAGYNITSSEMGHLFYTELGNLGYFDTSGNYVGDGEWGLLNTGDFQNLQPDRYWSGTEYSANPSYAWFFDFSDGVQGPGLKSSDWYTRLPCVPEMSPRYQNQARFCFWALVWQDWLLHGERGWDGNRAEMVNPG
jgi:hypothetical protein